MKCKIDLNEKGRDFPHYWELSVGSCHAATLLRADVQEQIRKAHKDIGFKYLRCHGLLDDDMSVVISPMLPGLEIPGMGEEQISFFNIDRVIDFLLDTGMKPFVEVGFMPELYASTEQSTFHYKGFSSMPKDDAKWMNLVRKMVEHLQDRYGVNEVSTWFFEVWNEPNLRFFFDGTMEDYFRLYEMTAKAIKSVNPIYKVGGPATSNNMWIPEFREFCEKNDVPYDFITTHHYPSDDPLSRAGMNGAGTKGDGLGKEAIAQIMALPDDIREETLKQILSSMDKPNTNPRDILYKMAKKAKEEAGDYPLYYTEWNVGHYDTNYCAAGIVATQAYNENLVEGYSFWCVSDIFEEMGLHGLPFNNEFGLVNVYGTPKPSYRVFEALHEAGTKRLDVHVEDESRTAEVLALADDNQVMVFVYNHDIEERDIHTEQIRLNIVGDVSSIQKAVIDENHTAPIKEWEKMGKPTYLDKNQIKAIESASSLWYENLNVSGNDVELELTALPESVTIFKIIKK